MKKIALFMLLLPIFTETLSANNPIEVFIANPVLFLLQVIFYGVPVVLIRETAVRWNVGLKGVFLMGLAYGFLNEGIAARTLANTHTFIGDFNASSFIFGLNPFWTTYIVTWHALLAVLYPILLIQYFYPSWEPWLGKRGIKFFACITILGSLIVVSMTKDPQSIVSLVFILLLMLLAKVQKSKVLSAEPLPAKKPFVLGFLFILHTVISIMIATKISLAGFLLYQILAIYILYALMRRSGFLSPAGMLLFALGSYTSFALFVMTFGIPSVTIVNALLVLFFALLARKVLRTVRLNPRSEELTFADL